MNAWPRTVDDDAEEFAARSYRRITISMAAFALALAPVIWIKFGLFTAISFAIGCGIAYLNFYWLKRTVAALVDAVAATGERRSSVRVLLWFVFRYLLIAIAAYVIFKRSALGLYGLFAGLSLPVAGVMVEAAYAVSMALRHEN